MPYGPAAVRWYKTWTVMVSMCRHALVILVVLALGSPGLRAAKYAGDPFSLGVGARALAMGGAAAAGPFDGTAAYWNPAGMNLLEGRHLAAMHAETFGSLLNHDFAAYTNSRVGANSFIRSFGFYVYYLGGGGIKITKLNEFERPYVLREESHGDYLLAAAVAGRIAGKVDFGLTAKIIYRDIGPVSGKGLTVDAGLLYQPREYLRLGLMVTDITTGFIRYPGYTGEGFQTSGSTESIYPTIKPGLLLEHTHRDFTGRFAAAGDVKFENLGEAAQLSAGSASLDGHFGCEIDYRGMVFGRLGFDMGRFTTGVGIDVSRLTVDFAYLHHSDLDETFRVSAEYSW